jgi:hypothetical protein
MSDTSEITTTRQLLKPTPDLWTSVTVRGNKAVYGVLTTNVLYQERLEHMGFAPAGEGKFIRSLSADGEVLQTHANFAQHLEEMLLQSARLRHVGWEETLDLFISRVNNTPLHWFLYGSGALAVRGIDVDPGDLDFCVSDAQLAGYIFKDLLVEPVTKMNGWVADYGGRAFSGCLFEWIAGVHSEVDEPLPHEQGLAAAQRIESVRWHEHKIFVAPLDLQLAVTERRGLTDRAMKIRAHIASK